MREPLKSMLENLPKGLHLENGSLFAFCNDCNKKIEYEIRQRNIKEGPYYCKNCTQKHKKFGKKALENLASGAKKRSGKGICTRCGKESNNRNSAGLCPICYSYIINIFKTNKKSGNCSICGKFNKHRDQNARGIECKCSQKELSKMGFGFNLLLKDNPKCKKHLNCNFVYFNNKTDKYECWECYKENFHIENINFNLPKGFKLYPTFRTQDSINWNGAKAAFEQNLVDNNINWFVYIKFYIDQQGYIKPLVVGKSGSLNVNSNGSDVSFSMNINDGPARRFLKENADKGFEWCKTKIAICKAKSELEAYTIEKDIALKYNLFES